MPLVRITLVGDVLSIEQKRELIGKVTDGVASVMGENLRPYTVVSIDEAKDGDLAFGGQTVTAADIRALAAGAAPAGV